MTLRRIPSLHVQLGNKRLVAQALTRLIPDSEKAARLEFKETTLNIRDAMAVPGKKVSYPINWDSEKQRRFVMWLLRSMNNLPYKRMGNYIAHWIQKTIRGGYEVANRLKFAGFIAGDIRGLRQSNIHKGRWPVFRKVFDKAYKLLPAQIRIGIKKAIRALGFKVN